MRNSPDNPLQRPLTPAEKIEQASRAQAAITAQSFATQMISEALAQLELRKWCVQEANKFCQTRALDADLISMASQVFIFVTEPIADTLKKWGAAEAPQSREEQSRGGPS